MPLQPIKTAQKNTFGGFMSASVYSGQVAPVLASCPGAVATGSDILLFSGAGRLDSVTAHTNLQSGLNITFYDAAVVTSGGPFSLSGHKIVGGIAATLNTNSGQVVFNSTVPLVPVLIGQPFMSGLCVNSRSGQVGFSVTWTPEISIQ